MSPQKNSHASFSMDDFARALSQHDYDFQAGQVVPGKVFSVENSGAFVDIGGKSLAFLPLNEVALHPPDQTSEVLSPGEEHQFFILRGQDADGQVTLSLRRIALLRAWERIAELNEAKQIVEGRVTGTNKGGVTVEVEGLRGFVPRSHLVERSNLNALVGKTLMLSFLEVDQEQDKLVLSNRQAASVAGAGSLSPGELIEGRVTGIRPFGAFVEFGSGSGLLHIRAISAQFVQSIESVFKVGQTLKAVVTEVDVARGRVSLSTRVLENYPGEMLENPEQVMAEADKRVGRAQPNQAE
ncbi:S1 RNA-binding domain-containing protein [Leptolyngbya sp. FACHB-261]|uniref:S1 RNA-binding domain-containing protein n=1 Tax=Leptolyngbya sp. FACHB-261 TaxID=2692806 RepID=UPI001681EC62|nr:S1 RNA-binding domain-containing protein [Leptolyngbya sp. FACHB-261]MBD2104600.1 S1 RNA-binding domain-containing protein [Leptolyngbya sp. FACHB-261]